MTTSGPSRPPRSPLRTGLAAGIPTAALALVAVGVLPMVFGNTADVSDIEVRSETAEVGQAVASDLVNGFTLDTKEAPAFNDTTWIVPVAADWGSFPDETLEDASVGCTIAQMTWLASNGLQKPKATAFTFHNESTEGQSLSISDITLRGSVEQSSESILVACGATAGGMGPAQMVFAEVTAGGSSPAIASEDQDLLPGADVDYVPGEVIVFNLRPGDTAQMTLQFLEPQQGQVFRGDLMASVSSGDVQQEMMLLPDVSFPREAANSPMIGIRGGVASCGRFDPEPNFPRFQGYESVDCPPSSVPVRMKNGWDAVANTISGTWTGSVEGDRRPYSLSVTIIDDGQTASARATYPEIPCEGTWEQTGRSASSLALVETMPEDEVCFDQVPVSLTIRGDTLVYEAESGGSLLSAELRRTSD